MHVAITQSSQVYERLTLICRFMDLVVSFPVNNIRIVHKSKAECFAFRISVRSAYCITFLVMPSSHDRSPSCLCTILEKYFTSFGKRMEKDLVMIQSSLTRVHSYLTTAVSLFLCVFAGALKGWLAFLTILDITMVILSFLSVLLIFGTLKRAIKLGRVSIL